MADIKVRRVPDHILDWHRAEAGREGISLEERIRRVLHEEYVRSRRELVAEMDALCAKLEKRTGALSDSTPLIREIREDMESRFDVRRGRERRGEVARTRRRTA